MGRISGNSFPLTSIAPCIRDVKRVMNVAIVFAVFAMTASSVCFGQLSSVPISGGTLPLCPRCIVISIDDLPYNKWQSGPADPPSWTLAYFQYLHLVRRVERGVLKRGVPA